MNREPIKILSDIIKSFMELSDNQIVIYNQDFKIPPIKGVFVVLQYESSSPYSVIKKFMPASEGEEGAQESISLMTRERYMINVFSKNDEARIRKEEVILALNSSTSLEEQEKYQFKIANFDPSFINLSELEGAGMLNRFGIGITLLCFYNKVRETAYYDQFSNNLIVN